MERESSSVAPGIRGQSRAEFRGGFRFDLIGRALAPARAPLTYVVLTLLVALFLFSYVPSRTGSVFVSPDETSMFLATKWLATTGKLFDDKPIFELDSENLLHPRGFVTTDDGRVVPYNFLGLPVIYAPAYRLLGPKGAEFFGVWLGLVGIVALWGTLRILSPRHSWLIILVFACTPLIYYFSRPFLNVVPAVAFLLMGSFFLAKYYRDRRVRDLGLASGLFALSMFARYEYSLFIAAFVLIFLWQIHGRLTASHARDLVVFLGFVFLIFGIPLLVFNGLTYGSPFTYGYALFDEAYYPARAAPEGAPVVVKGAKALLTSLFPSGFHVADLIQAIWRYLFQLTPVLTIFGAGGFLIALRLRLMERRYLLAYGLLFLYMLLYQGSGRVWGTQSVEPALGQSMARYWIPNYLVLFLLTAVFIVHFKALWLRVLLAMTIAVVGFITVLWQDPSSLRELEAAIDGGTAYVEQQVLPYTEENALIYAGRHDKFILPFRQVAAWMNRTDTSFYDADEVATSMAKLHAQGMPVYLYKEPEVDIGELNSRLHQRGLLLSPVPETRLYALQPLNRASPETGQEQ